MTNIHIYEHQTFFLLSVYNSQIVIQDGCQRASCYWMWQVTSKSKDQDRSGLWWSHPRNMSRQLFKTHQLEWVCEHSLPKLDWTLCSMCSWAQLKIMDLLILVGNKRQNVMGYNTRLLTKGFGVFMTFL